MELSCYRGTNEWLLTSTTHSSAPRLSCQWYSYHKFSISLFFWFQPPELFLASQSRGHPQAVRHWWWINIFPSFFFVFFLNFLNIGFFVSVWIFSARGCGWVFVLRVRLSRTTPEGWRCFSDFPHYLHAAFLISEHERFKVAGTVQLSAVVINPLCLPQIWNLNRVKVMFPKSLTRKLSIFLKNLWWCKFFFFVDGCW